MKHDSFADAHTTTTLLLTTLRVVLLLLKLVLLGVIRLLLTVILAAINEVAVFGFLYPRLNLGIGVELRALDHFGLAFAGLETGPEGQEQQEHCEEIEELLHTIDWGLVK